MTDATDEKSDWTQKVIIAVGECIAAQRNGLDVLASPAWDRLCALWCEKENRKALKRHQQIVGLRGNHGRTR